MDFRFVPGYLCGGRRALTKSEYLKLSKDLSAAKRKWNRLQAKYPDKTTREILELEAK